MEYRQPRPWIETKSGISLSIQGSESSYSTPREWLTNWEDYESVEIAMFDSYDENEPWVHPSAKFFDNFTRIEELLSYYEDGNCPVGAYVPVDLVEDLLLYLEF